MAEWAARARTHGSLALEAVEKLLREKPEKNGQSFSDAISKLVLLRDHYIAGQRAGATDAQSRKQLGQVNGILSAVIAGNYPLGRVPWHQVEKAREALALVMTTLRS